MSDPPDEQPPVPGSRAPTEYRISSQANRDSHVATLCLWAFVILIVGGVAAYANQSVRVLGWRFQMAVLGAAVLVILAVMATIKSATSTRISNLAKVLSILFHLTAITLIIIGVTFLVILGQCASTHW